jgi:hypothetical protein
MIYNSTTRPEGAKSIAQGNALCNEISHPQQALKGRHHFDYALSGLKKMVARLIRRALPYANDIRLSAL